MSIDIFQSKELKKNKKIKTDPITSEIIRNSLNSAAEQMKKALVLSLIHISEPTRP